MMKHTNKLNRKATQNTISSY